MNRAAKYVVFDTETGGIEASTTSLLTAYFGILNAALEPIAELDMVLKPDNGVYAVTAGALNVNKIDLIKHDKEAIPYSQATIQLFKFLSEYSTGDKYNKLIPIAHNIPFDYSFVFDKLLEKHLWEENVGYRAIDTMGIALFLQLQGKLPTYNLQLATVAKALNVQPIGDLHRAKTDALVCAEVLKKMLKL
jgi:DNA polymerase III alpha subunit (gram-positive type)